ncbi:hypothetical protein SAMD00019534_047430 [Acytostelium subglobosum LB1]|uniref:hypothetical protein n=1 Tax=Acytostelium subglobosum LB1 TaxID=1410327 RepID=UPI0006451941|nr:hypothetical protein SAMD00019534_047430 [Acytostelium subglobosum LB1]GAM21568.1 hypothetical protein SAMD00019534_047430 [Acytostelium subglobosum LB1]|eukprot:XP_012755687.1 hypothetical protein SAMD00019534_047430 [Acytostelium subglobosum LB1]
MMDTSGGAPTAATTVPFANAGKIDFDTLDESIGRIAKKQKTTLSKTIKDIDSIIATLNQSKSQLMLLDTMNDDDTEKMEVDVAGFVPKVISNLHKTLSESKFCLKVQSEHKELHAPVSKIGKTVDKCFRSDIEQASKDIEFDRDTLNNLILNHLYREGQFDVGDLFAQEMGMMGESLESLKSDFIDHHDIVGSIEKKDLQPAINWCKHKRTELAKLDTHLEFKLHKLQFIHLLGSKKNNEALMYAKAHFPDHSNSRLKEIQSLMGTFLYTDRLSTSPYQHMFDPKSISHQWSDIKTSFSRDSFALMGLPQESPLAITVTVGVKSLPTFIKLASFSVLKDANDDSLTVDIHVDQKYKFHSIFSCPVSREQSTKNNPPVILQCGHLLAKNSMLKLVKGASGKFKCPYCPIEQNVRDVKQIYL